MLLQETVVQLNIYERQSTEELVAKCTKNIKNVLIM